MEFTRYLRKPFVIEAIEITEDNIADLAEYIGTLKYKGDGSPYIAVDRRLIPKFFKVYPGFWMTRVGDQVRCYSRKVFFEQFMEMTEDLEDFLEPLLSSNDAVEVS